MLGFPFEVSSVLSRTVEGSRSTETVFSFHECYTSVVKSPHVLFLSSPSVGCLQTVNTTS